MLVGRWNIWTAAAAMTIQHPLFGVGVGNFQNFYPAYSGHRFGVNHAHNLFLNIAAERGLPAFLVFAALIITLFRVLAATLARTRTTLEQALVAGLAATFLAYFVHSWFEVSYYDYKVLLLFWLLVGTAVTLPAVLAPSPQGAAAVPLAGSLRSGMPAQSEAPHGRE
jgi:putative inorganic carbon (HCO3(-)) transporter